MSESNVLAAAKATPPSCAGLYPRERLFRRLDGAAPGSAVWICGPAGSGKSSLLTSFLTARHRRALWYRIDEGDVDLGQFFRGLGGAVCAALNLAEETLPAFTGDHRADPAAFAGRFFRELFLAGGPALALVLDDLDRASGDVLPAVVCRCIEEMPADSAVYITSRTSPSEACARLSLNRKVVTLGWEELRLTPEETAGMAALEWRELREDEAQQLYDQTDGWAAGVTLVLQSGGPRGAALTMAPTEREAMFRYFAEEVLAGSDPDLRDFMLRTAWLPWIPERVARAFAPDADAMLAALRGRHCFTDRLENAQAPGESVYRYHDLFREFLRAWTLRNLPREDVVAMRTDVAAICAEEGLLDVATALYLAEEFWEEAANLIHLHGEDLLARGCHATLQGWLSTFPAEQLDQHPPLALWLGLCRAGNDQAAARALFERAFAGFKQRGDVGGALRAWCEMTDLSISPVNGLEHLHRYVEWLETYLPEFPEDLPPELKVRTASAMRRALWHCRPGDPGNERWGELADLHLAAIASPDVRVRIAEARLAEHVSWTGNYAKAQSVYLTVEKLAGDADLSPLTRLRLALARNAFHWSHASADAGLEAVADGMRIAEEAQLESHRSLLSLLAFRYCMMLGRKGEARRHLDIMAASQDGGTIEDRLRHHVSAVWFALEVGDAAIANGHAIEALRLADTAEVPCAHVLALIALAQTRFALGNRVEAATLINWALGLAQKLDSVCWQFNCLIIKAYIGFAGAAVPTPPAEAIAALTDAFAMGSERGFVFFNFCRPAVLQVLCAAALLHGIEPDYARRLILAHRLGPAENASESWPWPVMIYTLRPFAMYCGGKLVKFPAKAQAKPVALLKALVALGGDRVSEAMLTQILWPDAEGDRAHWVFRVTLRRLRQLLGGSEEGNQVIELSDGQISLNPALVWTDVRGFAVARDALDKALRNAAACRSAGHAAADVAVTDALNELFALYRGHFLAQENSHEEVFLPAREKLRSHFRRAVRDAAHHWEARGDWLHAADCYQKALEIDAVAEELYCGLMHAYAQQGLAAEAMRTYQRCVEVLNTMLSMKPGRRLQELLDALRLQHDAELALAARG
jgi:LuxR family maltose regulon positive regulatory protein